MKVNLKANPFYLDEEDIKWVKETYESLSLEEKLGQLFLPAILPPGTQEQIDALISVNPAGIHRILSMNPKDLHRIGCAFSKAMKVPLLFTGDMEFSSFSEALEEGISPFPGVQNVAATGNAEYMKQMGMIASIEGGALGYNWNFAPVVDIIHNPLNSIVGTRSFSSDPDMVIEMARPFVETIQGNEMAACAKHWPGDGVDLRDQHMLTTCNSLDMDAWRNTYGKVYKNLIDMGVLSIMSAHLTLPAYDRELNPNVDTNDILPGSISSTLNKNLLRDELGFNGVITSDATNMSGLTSVGKLNELIPLIIENGCDIILMPMDIFAVPKILMKAVQEGKLSEKRIEEANLRVLALKAKLKLHKQSYHEKHPTFDSVRKELSNKERKSWGKAVADESITLVKDTQQLLPITPEKHKRVLLMESEPLSVLGSKGQLTKFADYLESEGFDATRRDENTIVDPQYFDLIVYLVDQKYFFGEGSFHIEWGKLHKGGSGIKAMIQVGDRYWDIVPTIMISTNNPFHLNDAPQVKTYINTYSRMDMVMKSLVDKLVGKSEFKGKSPFDPTCEIKKASQWNI